ncbi:protein FAR1-RELATED SEQUENCE 5-like [Silene latifolia]|uniref:protein FAR1-RELATED SEQUENCE 5-like n=1 Tax=Silene latifolia TaxID=37657 RepID=UPI003D76CC2D
MTNNDNDDTIPPLHNDDIVDEDVNPGSIILKDGSIVSLKEDFDASGSLVGLKATKWEYLLTLYNKHAAATGFGTRKGTRRIEKNVEYERYFVCNCLGEHGNGRSLNSDGTPSSSGTQTKKVNITRSVCKAFIWTQLNGKGLWEILNHNLDHNHSLTPPQWQHNHRSERKITAEEGEVIEMMTEALVRPYVQYRVLAAISGGEEFVGYTKRDHINYVNMLKMRAIEGGDASTLVELLTKCQSEDPDESFEWLFNAFNESMGEDVRPVTIFTDQDLAMTNAIKEVYPTSRHRLCQWHIQQNVVSHYGSLKHNRSFQPVFNKCLNGCYSEAEFEDTWRKMISDYGLAFEKEFGIAIGTRAIECTTEDHIKSYLVYPSGTDENPHHVTFDSSNLLIDCTCRKFQECGMLCFHSIRILHLRSVSEIPDRYILRRWTKFAKKEVWDRLLPNDRRRSGINEAVN